MKKKNPSKPNSSGSEEMSERFKEQGDWQGKMLARMRKLINEVDPEVVEEMKWKKPSNPAGVATWSHDGLICTGEMYQDHVKLTFAKGASLEDPQGLFTQQGSVRRAIDIYENGRVNETAFKNLIQAAVVLNVEQQKKKKRT